MARNTPKQTSDTVVAIQAIFALVDGKEMSCMGGQVMRATDRLVRAHPNNFVDQGANCC
jgi:hypothetical protein